MEDECIEIIGHGYLAFFAVENRVFELYFELTDKQIPDFGSFRCSRSLFNLFQQNLSLWKQVLERSTTPEMFIQSLKQLISVSGPSPFLTEQAFDQVSFPSLLVLQSFRIL